jgi:hypothetical protein
MRLFFDIPDDDLSGVELAYMQAVHDVTDSRYPCTEHDCLTLAAMQAQEKFGDYVSGANVLEGNLHEFLPDKYLRGNRDEELMSAIYKIYKRLEGYSSARAKQVRMYVLCCVSSDMLCKYVCMYSICMYVCMYVFVNGLWSSLCCCF